MEGKSKIIYSKTYPTFLLIGVKALLCIISVSSANNFRLYKSSYQHGESFSLF